MLHICIIKQEQMVSDSIKRGVSSAGSEHLPYKQGVTGSNPVSPTEETLQIISEGFCVLKLAN